MGNFVDLTGQKFGRLTVIRKAENTSEAQITEQDLLKAIEQVKPDITNKTYTAFLDDINEILETDMFSKYELYQTLLILGDQKKVLNVEKHQNIKIYTDPISNKKYTKKSN